MYWDVLEVEPTHPYTLFLRFRDGLSGELKLNPAEFTGVLAPLRDPGFFRQVFLESGTIAWPGDIELAPDAMHAQLTREQQALQAH